MLSVPAMAKCFWLKLMGLNNKMHVFLEVFVFCCHNTSFIKSVYVSASIIN